MRDAGTIVVCTVGASKGERRWRRDELCWALAPRFFERIQVWPARNARRLVFRRSLLDTSEGVVRREGVLEREGSRTFRRLASHAGQFRRVWMEV